MFNPVSFFIGLRYTRAKRRNHFISFISLVSMIGIALGVMVLITVLSVMNGFDQEIKKRVFTMVPPMSVSSSQGAISNWQTLQANLQHFPSVSAVSPYVNGEVLLSHEGTVQPALVTGILPSQEKNVSGFADKIVQGQISALAPGSFGIIIGEALANRLDVTLGDKITVMTPQVILSPVGVFPQSKRFTVVGIFRTGGGFGFDAGLGFVSLQDAQKLFGLGTNVSGLHLNVANVYGAPALAQKLAAALTEDATVSTWADQFGDFFHAVQLEKTMMFFILLLIVAVAAFNLVSTLVMVVNDKQADIAILRTFGATPRMIMTIFIIQGAIVGLLGTALGVIGGLLLASNATAIVNGIEHLFGVQLLAANVYFVNYLPSKIEAMDIVVITIASIGLSLLATLYPAWRASQLDPVESLRYE